MFITLFRNIVITSFAGSALAFIIILSRPVTKKFFGYNWHYYIWLSVLIAMMLPVHPNFVQAFGGMNSTEDTQVSAGDYFAMDAQNIQTPADARREQKLAPYPFSTIPERNPDINAKYTAIKLQTYLGILFLIGMIVMLSVNIIRYILLLKKIRRNALIKNSSEFIKLMGSISESSKKIGVYTMKDISSPFMLGLFHPMLILPEADLNEEQLGNIFMHELTHFRRGDIWYKWFALIVRCVHWFNPVAYYVTRQIGVECEISCDLSVINGMSGAGVKSYTDTILSLLSDLPKKDLSPKLVDEMHFTTYMTGNKKILQKRFSMMKDFKKISIAAKTVSAIAAFSLIFAVFMSSSALNGYAANVLDDPLFYYNEEMGFSIAFPKDYAGNYQVVTGIYEWCGEPYASFYLSKSENGYDHPWLFSISRIPEPWAGSYVEYSPAPISIMGYDDDYAYTISVPSDVQVLPFITDLKNGELDGYTQDEINLAILYYTLTDVRHMNMIEENFTIH